MIEPFLGKKAMIRVLVVDNHILIRRSIRALLDNAADIEVVGEARDGNEAVDLVKELRPDLVIMDVAMPKMDGIAATAHIRSERSSSEVIILSMYDDQSLVQQARRNGAKGYLLKRTVSDELLPAIYQVIQGREFLSSALTS